MKKFTWVLAFFLLFLVPWNVKAKDGIKNYNIDLTVQENGDVLVKEMFVLEGEFNGYERILHYKNEFAPRFDGSLSSFQGSDIYNASALSILKVGATSAKSDWNNGNVDVTTFNKVGNATKGEYGIYTATESYSGKSLMIYNPSSKGTSAFYIEYLLKDMAVVHDDVAELGFNLFSDELQEEIKHLEMLIHLPGNQQELRAWGHGPLWGETENVDSETVRVWIDSLDAGTPVDVRVVFDRSVVSKSNKLTDMKALESILEVESTWAEEANQKRSEARKMIFVKKVISGVEFLFLLGFLPLVIHVYRKYDKEYEPDFQGDYYRDFPKEYGPEIVGYLLHKQIGNDDLSAAILNLVNQKVIDFEEEPKKKKDYSLQLKGEITSLSEKDQKLITFLFDGSDRVTLSSLKKSAKSDYESFLNHYKAWKNSALKEAKSYHFYEKIPMKGIVSLYPLLGILFSIFGFAWGTYLIINLLLIIGSFAVLFYFAMITKRSQEGNEDYAKWNALKHFMLDFGTMNEKELPEVRLWEKYLVYALSLGCADKLAKTMKIRAEEMNLNEQMGYDPYWSYYRMHMMLSFNRSLNQSIQTSISNAHSAQIAASSNSSSGGFGGGFSGGGGGGSFGGGGGGGRF